MDIAWRAPFTSTELNALHAECFETRLYSDEEWDWADLCAHHSLGWASARTSGVLVGFANVIWDGLTHAWIHNVMVAAAVRRAGIGAKLVRTARDEAKAAGCEWLHVDFEDHLRPFYLGACGFTAAQAGLIRL
jgi:GNAT superfamily N-acetyltransferase